MLCCSGCATTASDPVQYDAPPFPKAGPAVGKELETLPEDKYPALWDWLKRITNYADQIGVS
jgi:hypothetical protein